MTDEDNPEWYTDEADPWDAPELDVVDRHDPEPDRAPPSSEPVSVDPSSGFPCLPDPYHVYYYQRSADDGRWVDLRNLDENEKLCAGVMCANPIDGCVLTSKWEDVSPLQFDRSMSQQLPSDPEPHIRDGLEPLRIPEIFIDADILATADAVIQVLGRQPDPLIFKRNGMLVDVIHSDEGKPVIRQTPEAYLHALVSSCVHFRTRTSDGSKPAKCPKEVVAAVAKRGQWPGIKQINGVISWPTIRRDGRVLAGYGYDPHSKLLCEARYDVPQKRTKTLDDAKLGLLVLKDLICDFPFESDEHRSAWLAFLLTMTCRHAIPGPVPLMLIDAVSMGSGKTLLADLVWLIVTGERIPRSVIPTTDEEWGKTLVSIAIGAQPLVLFDNLTRKLRSEALDAVLTGTSFGGRLLATNQDQRFSTPTVFCITANNAQISSDLVRRSLHIRIAPTEERPELRSGFRYGDIAAQVMRFRPTYQDCALSVIRAYCSAGRPKQAFPSFGSFEAWSDLVRSALVWAGEPDPVATQAGLRDSSDSDTEDLENLLMAWYTRHGTEPVYLANMIQDALLTEAGRLNASDHDPLREAIVGIAGFKGRLPDAHRFGTEIRRYKERTVSTELGSLRLKCHKKTKTGRPWSVERT